MRNKIKKSISVILAFCMICSLLSVGVFAADDAAAVNIKIEDIKDNVVSITASAEKDATIILASYEGEKLLNMKLAEEKIIEGTKDYTVEGFEKGDCDKVKAFVWENKGAFYVPLCNPLEETQISAVGTVAIEGGLPDAGVQIQASESITADVPQDVELAENTTQLTLSVTTKDESESGILPSETEELLSLDVHIDGVSATNTVPIEVNLGPVLDPYMNSTSIKLYHIENGETVPMTYVANDMPFTAHNQFKYDPATGGLIVNLATFSEITTFTNTTNVWEGNIDTSWYEAKENGEYFLYNAEQLAGFGQIVGGMAGVVKQDTFDDDTVYLAADIDLGDDEANNVEDKIFHPIGYYYTDDKNEDGTKGDYYSTVWSFEGTFDGQGHTIKNFYQNTWEIKGDYEGNYYSDGMGLFGYVLNGEVKNLTIDHFSSDGEFTPTGCVAAFAKNSTFENIAITNCNPRVYNTGNGGIIGIAGNYNDNETQITLKNITVDNTNKISALWGSWDVACGGLVGMFRGNAEGGTGRIHFENCHVSAQIDVNNDVCANYQYYAYRYAGMIIGSIRHNTTNADGRIIPVMDGITANGCTVNYGDWNDYYYCELVANSLASYTHDHQFSRLEQVDSVDAENKTVTVDGKTTAIPTEGRVNYVVVNGEHSTENATCYHFVNGKQHKHDVADDDNPVVSEIVDGIEVLKEDKKCVYLPFEDQLFTGYSWGVDSRGIKELEGIVNLGGGITEGEQEESVEKFKAKFEEIYISEIDANGYKVSDFFEGIPNLGNGLEIANESVVVSITAVDTNATAGTYTPNDENWENGTIKFEEGFEGLVKLTIQDYQFCKPTTVYLTIMCPTVLSEVDSYFSLNDSNPYIGRILFPNFLELN